MDFDEAAESAVAKRKFLLNRLMQKKLLPEDNDEEEVEEEVETSVSHVTLIRVCDSRVLVIISKTPHKMRCYNQLPENDQKVVCKKAYVPQKILCKEHKANPGPAKKISCR